MCLLFTSKATDIYEDFTINRTDQGVMVDFNFVQQ